MYRDQFAQRYTGERGMPFAPAQHSGNCRSCGHPSAQCQCGCRECRKEAKELVVTAEVSRTAVPGSNLTGSEAAAPGKSATGTAFIGGGCCVHISLEYVLASPTQSATVEVVVTDSEGLTLGWRKIVQPGANYQVQENIMTTKPGATVVLIVTYATARIRWCEVFSC